MQKERKRFSWLCSLVFALMFAIAGFTSLQATSFTAHAAIPTPSIDEGVDTTSPVLFIQGFSFAGSSGKGSNVTPFDCNQTWGNATNYLTAQSRFTYNGSPFTWNPRSLVTIGYYQSETARCNKMLSPYKNHCQNTYHNEYDPYGERKAAMTSAIGTNDESIEHLACEFAWLIFDNYSSHGQYVRVVAHSMGGLITRWALYATQQRMLQQTPSWDVADFPTSPLLVSDVVTFDTPHGGVLNGAATAQFLCGECEQGNEMELSSPFMHKIVAAQGHDLRTSGSPNWTLLGMSSVCSKDVVNSSTSMYMDGVHKFVFLSPCFDHGGFMSDINSPQFTLTQQGKGGGVTLSNCSTRLDSRILPQPDINDGAPNDAIVLRGDNTSKDSDSSTWDCFNRAPHALKIMLLALLQQSW